MIILTEQNARKVLGEDSMQHPVFIYFYVDAPECAPVTRAVDAKLDNHETYTLVHADVSEPVGNMIAMQLGLQGVPALVVISQGRPVDFLQGEEVPAKLDELAAKYQPKQSDLDYKAAIEADKKGDQATALSKAKSAYEADPKNLDFKFLYARLCIRGKNLEKAAALLANPGREEQEMQDYKDLVSALHLAEQAQESPAIKELERKHQASPADTAVTRSLAVAYAEAGRRREALDMLMEMITGGQDADAARQTYLDILSTMAGDPLQKTYRNKLYTLMY